MALENWFQAGKLVKHEATKEELSAIFGVIERNFQDAGIKGLSSDQKYILSTKPHLKRRLRLLNAMALGLLRQATTILHGSA